MIKHSDVAFITAVFGIIAMMSFGCGNRSASDTKAPTGPPAGSMSAQAKRDQLRATIQTQIDAARNNPNIPDAQKQKMITAMESYLPKTN